MRSRGEHFPLSISPILDARFSFLCHFLLHRRGTGPSRGHMSACNVPSLHGQQYRKWTVNNLAMISIGRTQVMNKQKQKQKNLHLLSARRSRNFHWSLYFLVSFGSSASETVGRPEMMPEMTPEMMPDVTSGRLSGGQSWDELSLGTLFI